MKAMITSTILLKLLCPFALSSPSPLEKGPLVLGVGEQRLLHCPGLLKYSLGSGVVRILPLPKKSEKLFLSSSETLLIKAVAAGHGDLWVWKQDGTTEHRAIRIEKLSAKNEPLERALGKLEEVEVIFTGKGTVLRGELNSWTEAAQISALLKTYPDQIYNETEISPQLLNQAQAKLNHWLNTFADPSRLRIEQTGQSLWLRGHVQRRSEQKSIEQQARALFPLIQVEVDSLPDQAPTVYFRVFLLELKRSQFHSIGLSWPAVSSHSLKATPGSIQDIVQLDLTLQHLEGHGHAKILSNPELVVRAPGEAELFAGGELPIQTQSRFYSNVTWKNYGLTLRLKVTHWAGDRVRLDIFTEVSHLDRQATQEQIPGIQSNRMKTQIDAKFGTPLLLSGLLKQGVHQEAKGLPFLRQIPILGALFGSEDYLNERSELVALLYPDRSPPSTPLEISKLLPKGRLPPPREWLNPSDIRKLQASKEYPWNALE